MDRRSTEAIFAPLDPDERLPRELIFEPEPGWTWGIRIGRQHVAGLLWVPALLATLGVFTWFGNPLLLFAAVALLLVGFATWAFRPDSRGGARSPLRAPGSAGGIPAAATQHVQPPADPPDRCSVELTT